MRFTRDADLDAERDTLHRVAPWEPKMVDSATLRQGHPWSGPGVACRQCRHCGLQEKAEMRRLPDREALVAPSDGPGTWLRLDRDPCIGGQAVRAKLRRDHRKRYRRASRRRSL